MVKDRLNELIQKRNKRIWPIPPVTYSAQEPGVPLRSNDLLQYEVIELESFGDTELDVYLAQVAGLRSQFGKMKGNVDRIKSLQESLFYATNRDKDTEKELDSLMDSMKFDIRVGLKALKEMEAAIQAKDGTGSKILSRIKLIQYESLKKTFNDQLYYYQQVEVEHKDNCKLRIKRMLDISNCSEDGAETESFLEDGNISVFTNGYQEKTNQARLELGIADAQCKDLLKIEATLKDLHSMFLEMSQLVSLQGEIIDNIEKNVTDAEDITESANKQLENAKTLQKKARKKKILIILFLVLLVIIIGIFVYI